jgi:hypothetical protein
MMANVTEKISITTKNKIIIITKRRLTFHSAGICFVVMLFYAKKLRAIKMNFFLFQNEKKSD